MAELQEVLTLVRRVFPEAEYEKLRFGTKRIISVSRPPLVLIFHMDRISDVFDRVPSDKLAAEIVVSLSKDLIYYKGP